MDSNGAIHGIGGIMPNDFDKMKEWLEKQAAEGKLVSYQDASAVIDKGPSHPYLWWLLGEISKKTFQQNKILLSIIVVNKNMKPGGLSPKGGNFKTILKEAGIDKPLDSKEDIDRFVFNEMRRVWTHYRR